MITILDGKLNIPEVERFIGFAGDNLNRTIKFLLSGIKEQSRIYRLYLTFDDGTCNYFVLPSEETDDGVLLTWQVKVEHIFKSGIVRAQIKAFSDTGVVYHTTPDTFIVGESAELSDTFLKENSEFLEYERRLNDLADTLSDICVMMPYIGDNGNWYIYDADKGEYTDSGKPSVGKAETADIADGAVITAKLANDAVTAEKINAGTFYPLSQFGETIEGHEVLVRQTITTGAPELLRVPLSLILGLITVDSVISGNSENPVQNKAITEALRNRWIYNSKTCSLFSDLDEIISEYYPASGSSYADITSDMNIFSTAIRITINSETELSKNLEEKSKKETWGDFIATPYLVSRKPISYGLKLFSLADGTLWSYAGSSSDGFEKLDVSNVIFAGSFETLEELQAYPFRVDTLYELSFSGGLLSETGIDAGGCIGSFTTWDNGKVNGILRLINYHTGICWEFNITTGEAKQTSALDRKLTEMGEKLTEISDSISDIEERLDTVELASWASLQELVRSGRAAEFLSVGDQLVCEHERYGNLTWKVIGIDHDTPADENLTHSLTLRLDTAIPSVQFDAPEAFAYVTTKLTANTPYSFSVDDTDDNAVYFIPTDDVPVGACILFPYYDYPELTDTPLYIYESVSDTEPLMSLAVSLGWSGVDLADVCSFNDTGRAQYGSSNWTKSAIRQFLNSSAEAGSVWSSQGDYDRPPEWMNTEAGFLNGLDEDFLKVIGEVKKETFLTNLDFEGGTVAESTEKFFLPSATEMYAGDYRTNEMTEGKPYEYYSKYSATGKASISADANRIIYLNGKAVYSYLRSPNHTTDYETCYTNTKGGVYSIPSCNDYDSYTTNIVINPCCCIV